MLGRCGQDGGWLSTKFVARRAYGGHFGEVVEDATRHAANEIAVGSRAARAQIGEYKRPSAGQVGGDRLAGEEREGACVVAERIEREGRGERAGQREEMGTGGLAAPTHEPRRA